MAAPVRLRCPACGAANHIEAPVQNAVYRCWNCNAVVYRRRPQDSGALPVGTALGGVALGAAIGGPPGAVLGGILGLLLGAAASNK